jgi:uncharacterized protein (UPF0335 family)
MNKVDLQEKRNELLVEIEAALTRLRDELETAPEKNAQAIISKKLDTLEKLMKQVIKMDGSIQKLPDSMPESDDEASIKTGLAFKRIDRWLVDVSRSIKNIMLPVQKVLPELTDTQKKSKVAQLEWRILNVLQPEYNSLIHDIEQELLSSEIVILPPYTNDKELVQDVVNLETFKTGYFRVVEGLNSRIKGTNDLAKKEILYSEAIGVLGASLKQCRNLADKAHSRHESVIAACADYSDAQKSLKDIAKQAEACIEKTSNTSSKEILQVRDAINQQLVSIKKQIADSRELSFLGKLQIRTPVYKDAGEKLRHFVGEFQRLLENETAAIKNDVKEQKNRYILKFESLKSKLHENPIGTPELDKIEQEANSIISAENVPAATQLAAWKELNDKFEKIEKNIEQQLIPIIKEKITQFFDTVLMPKSLQIKEEMMEISKFLSDEERELLKSLNLEMVASTSEESYESLQGQYNDLLLQLEKLEKNIVLAREVISRHNSAEQWVNNFEDFIRKINALAIAMQPGESNNRTKAEREIQTLQRRLSQGSEEEFLKNVNEKISLFTPEARLILPRFFKNQQDIQNKMEFCNLLNENNAFASHLDHPQFNEIAGKILSLKELVGEDTPLLKDWMISAFKNDDLLAALSILEKLNIVLSEDTTKEFMAALINNQAKCKDICACLKPALVILGMQEIDVNKELIIKLANDIDKCVVICQQDKLNSKKEIRPIVDEVLTPLTNLKMKDPEYAGLFSYIINADEKLMSVIRKVGEMDNDFCQPSLLIFTGKSAELIDILANDENRESNIAILKGMLNPVEMAFKTFRFLSDERTHGEIDAFFDNPPSKSRPDAEEEASLQVKLKRLLEINNNPEENKTVKLGAVAGIITAIDDFIKNYNFKGDYTKKQEAYVFRRKAIPLLLESKSLDERKDNLSNLAKQEIILRNKEVRLLGDVLQMITLAFLVVMPTRLLLGKSAFFSTAKTERQTVVEEEIEEKMRDFIVEGDNSSDNPPESGSSAAPTA